MKRREGGMYKNHLRQNPRDIIIIIFIIPKKKNYFVRIESASLSKTVMCFVAYFALVFSLSKHVK